MNTKKILSAILVASMTMSFAGAFSAVVAADSGAIAMPRASGSADNLATAGVVITGDKDALTIANVGSKFNGNVDTGIVTLDGVNPSQTFYIKLGATTDPANTILTNDRKAAPIDLGDSNLFSLKLEKDGDGKSLVKSITQVDNYNPTGTRGSYLKVVLNDSTTTSELKANVKITFKARKDYNARGVSAGSGSTFKNGDTAVLDLKMWISNTSVNNDDNPASGDRVFFDPTKNDTNTLVWDDDRAALRFDADSDTSKFYARLSTKVDSAMYAKYGDPINAELWFYDFVSNPTIPSTSRATLTLGIPWEDDDAYIPDPEQCFIYQKDADGTLTDVTGLFKYAEDEEEIAGWSIRTRQLGTYVISDAELDIETVDEDEDLSDPSEEVIVPTPETGKNIPDTGASDMVNVAVAAAIISLAAAGAVAFKKASK